MTFPPVNFRKEKDSLGIVELPVEALYGAQTARALANFPISGRSASPGFIRAYLSVKLAAARTNLELGVLQQPLADLIESAIREILEQIPVNRWSELFPVDIYQAGAGTSQNMNLNEVIANLGNRQAGRPLGSYSPLHPNDHVNCSQSTNDTFPTAMRLALLLESAPLCQAMEELAESFHRKAEQWKDLPKSARTHLQDAVPMRLGQEFYAYARTLRRCRIWLEQGRHELRELGIGGSAAGTSLNVPEGYPEKVVRELSRQTGEPLRSAPDLVEAMQSQGCVAYYSGMLRLLALELTRICNDLRLLASGPVTGLAELTLPAAQPGSSIMPGKVNPSILEMVNQTLFSVLGQDHTTCLAVQAGQLELNVMMPVMAHTLVESTRISTQALKVLREKCIDGLEANEPRLRRYFESTPQVATALSPRLGYEATARLVQESLSGTESVVGLVRKRALIPEEELITLLDPAKITGR